MSLDLRSAVRKNIEELRRAIHEKTSEVARLEKELKRHETVLQLLSDNGAGRAPAQKNRRGRGGALGDVLANLPDTFTSREFFKAATRTKRSPVYLRQLLSRWARQGRIKRVQRGKYQKGRSGNVHRLAA